jgi:hypothetical protein
MNKKQIQLYQKIRYKNNTVIFYSLDRILACWHKKVEIIKQNLKLNSTHKGLVDL